MGLRKLTISYICKNACNLITIVQYPPNLITLGNLQRQLNSLERSMLLPSIEMCNICNILSNIDAIFWVEEPISPFWYSKIFSLLFFLPLNEFMLLYCLKIRFINQNICLNYYLFMILLSHVHSFILFSIPRLATHQLFNL